MATKYCDHGAYPAYAGVPTWGVPQDGDGTLKAPSTAASTASIVFTGTPAGAISVCGVSVSPSWGSGADAAANGLATAINAATFPVTTAGFVTGSVALRNAVYARGPSTGAPSGTCQIMSRHGSETINGQTAIAHTLTNVNAGASNLTFSGGVSGCWGYIANSSAMWPASIAVTNYGVFCATPFMTGTVAGGDVVKVRSAKTITLPTAANTMSISAMGSATAYVTFEIDDSTEWSGDGVNPQLMITSASSSGSHGIKLAGSTAAFAHVKGQLYGDGSYAVALAVPAPSTVGMVSIDSVGPFQGTGISLFGPVAQVSSGPSTSGGAIAKVLTDIKLSSVAQTGAYIMISGSTYGKLTLNRPIFEQTSAATPHSGVLGIMGGISDTLVELESPVFSGFVLGSALHVPAITTTSKTVLLRNPSFGGVSSLNSGQSSLASGQQRKRLLLGTIASTSSVSTQDFFIDSPGGYAAWISTRSYPTLGAKLRDGVTPWSMLLLPSQAAGNIGARAPFESPRLSMTNTLATAPRTVSVEIGVEQSLAFTNADVSILVEYEGADGLPYAESSHDHTGAALAVSAAAWTNASGSQFTYSEGGTLYFNKRKLSLTTKNQIKTGSEIGLVVMLHTPVADSTKLIFVDPQIQVS